MVPRHDADSAGRMQDIEGSGKLREPRLKVAFTRMGYAGNLILDNAVHIARIPSLTIHAIVQSPNN